MLIDPIRDFYAEGADAALAGQSDILPGHVSEHGPDAEAEWISGYESIDDEDGA